MTAGVGLLPRWLTRDHPLPWLAPWFAMIVAFGLYRLGYSVWLSLHQRNRFTRADEFAGLANWVQAFNDPRFLDALWVTLEDMLVCLVIQVVLGMAIALLLDCERRGYGVLGR